MVVIEMLLDRLIPCLPSNISISTIISLQLPILNDRQHWGHQHLKQPSLHSLYKNHADPTVLAGHHVYLAVDNVCYSCTVVDGSVTHTVETEFACTHEEADTRIVFHLSKLVTNGHPSVAVRFSDIDVFISCCITSHNVGVLQTTGVGGCWHNSNNSRRYINISQFVQHLDKNILGALPGFHAFTGSDYTASFMNKEKIRPFAIMKKNKNFVRAFASLGKSDITDELTLEQIEKFMCCMYGMPKFSKVNDARMALF